ncbi:MAG TPA: TMEM175 family protein [Streptosporangiaceae bacterium]|nr:TMEM175 family protein [Streptosporangiaceae bacterium]
MTKQNPPPGPRLRIGRLEAFSDGVFAIAITLLVLDLALPASAEAHLLRSVIDLWPSYLAYAASVSTIGGLWLGHVATTEYLDRTDIGFVRLNLLLLLVIAFLPFPTRLFAQSIGKDSPERVAATIYGLTLLLATTLLLTLWRYALRNRLVRPEAADEEDQELTKRLAPALAGYPALIIAGLFIPILAVIGYLAVALYSIIPFQGNGSVSFRRQ